MVPAVLSSLSGLGLGTAPLGGLFAHVDDGEAYAVVRRAAELGVRYVDTAPFYGHGTAERRLGHVLAELEPSTFVLSTKVGRLIVDDPDGDRGMFADAPPSAAVFDFSADGVRRSLDASLERLGVDHVDIVYIHDPDDHEDQAIGEAHPALRQLRDEGVVNAIGIGMNQSRVPARFVRETDIDVVLLAGRYTLLDQSGAEELLRVCLERGVAVVAGGVFNSGILADPDRTPLFDYQPAAPDLVTRARHLREICDRHAVPLIAAALKFPMRHPAVTSVLTGARSVAELEANTAAFEHPIPSELWAELGWNE